MKAVTTVTTRSAGARNESSINQCKRTCNRALVSPSEREAGSGASTPKGVRETVTFTLPLALPGPSIAVEMRR